MYNVAGIGVADLVGLVARVAQRTVPSRELVASPEMDNKLKSSIRSHLALSLVIDFWAGAVCLQLSFFNSVRLWNSRNPVLSFSDCRSLPWLGAVRWPSCHTALPCLAWRLVAFKPNLCCAVPPVSSVRKRPALWLSFHQQDPKRGCYAAGRKLLL